MKRVRCNSLWVLLFLLSSVFAQGTKAQSANDTTSQESRPNANAEADQTGEILGISTSVRQLQSMQSQRPCGSLPTILTIEAPCSAM